MQGFDLSTISNCYIGGAQASAIYLGSNKIWPATQHDYSQDPLTFEVLEAGQFKFNYNTNNTSPMRYSLDNGTTWVTMEDDTWTATIPLNSKIIFDCYRPTHSGMYHNSGIGKFSSTGIFNVSGNICSILEGYTGMNGTLSSVFDDFVFYELFADCNVISAQHLVLPTVTAASCYYSMFARCRYLSFAPSILPATTLSNQCYRNMFVGCYGLTDLPVLPATTLANECYASMFEACTNLTTAPALPATTLASYCYENMFDGCTSLTSAPELHASILAYGCYAGMFKGCTNLNSVTCLATDISATSCVSNWLQNVSATGTFTKAASMNDWTSGDDGIPSGWTVVNAPNT